MFINIFFFFFSLHNLLCRCQLTLRFRAFTIHFIVAKGKKNYLLFEIWSLRSNYMEKSGGVLKSNIYLFAALYGYSHTCIAIVVIFCTYFCVNLNLLNKFLLEIISSAIVHVHYYHFGFIFLSFVQMFLIVVANNGN